MATRFHSETAERVRAPGGPRHRHRGGRAGRSRRGEQRGDRAGPVARHTSQVVEARSGLRAGGWCGRRSRPAARRIASLSIWTSNRFVDDVQRAARWYRIDSDPATTRLSRAGAGLAGLTPRGRIPRRPAAGRSNGEIGAHLGISVKTASVHVSNIPASSEGSRRGCRLRSRTRHGVTGT